MPKPDGIEPRLEPEVTSFGVAADPAVQAPAVYITDGPLTARQWAEISAKDIVRVQSAAGTQLRWNIVDALTGLYAAAGRHPTDSLVAEGVKRVKRAIAASPWATQYLADQATIDLTDVLLRHFETAARLPR